MSFLLKDTIHTTLVDAVYNEVLSRRSNYYYFIGKVMAWDNPQNPDAPETTDAYERETRNKIISVKRITTTDVSYVVPRRDWTSGTVYDMFDDYSEDYPAYSGATSLKEANFYVLTSDFNVYKCLFNNNESPSTIQPTGSDPTPVTTADGYVWKYLYTIPLSNRTRFLTEDYMPVQKSVTNAYYSNGEIDRVNVDAAGSGFLGNSEVTLQVNGTFNSSNGNVVANLTPVFNTSGSIDRVIIESAGNNYASANIQIIDNAGTGVSLYYGLSNVIITNPGSGYLSNVVANTTAAVISTDPQPNSNAIVSLVFNENALVGVNVVNAGNGYDPNVAANTTLQISTTGDAQPTTNATVDLNFATTAILKPVLLNGQIDRVVVEDPGTNYRANIQTTLVLTGDGANARLIPFVNTAGEIEDVIIVERGEGYTFVDIEIVGDGSGANLSADLSTGDLDTTQSTVELSAIDGAIYSFRINNAGENYANVNVRIDGDGTGFAGTVIISNTNTISSITVTNPGVGYTFANVIITADSGSNANITAIFSPQGGHGSDAIRELFADTLIFYSTINNERIHGLDVNNDYRQYGIIKDIKQYGNQRSFANATGTPCFLVTLNTLTDSLSNTLADDTILETTSGNTVRTFEVVETRVANTQALLTSLDNFTLTAGTVLNDPITDSNFTVSVVDRLPTINKFSGDLLYIDNRTSISYSDSQLVTLRTVLRL
jgi:hypothetical protein